MDNEIYSLLGELGKEVRDPEKMDRLASFLCSTEDNSTQQIVRDYLAENPDLRQSMLESDENDDEAISLSMSDAEKSHLKSLLNDN